MNPRLAKEFRPLLLPWSVAALAAAGHFIALADANSAQGTFGSFLTGLAGVAFVVGCLVLTAMPMGFELHENTLTLLLSQPADRTRLWKDKLGMATIAVVALAVVHGLASAVAGQLRLLEALLYVAFMAGAVCSVGYWTLATRSILIGIACALSVPIWIASSVHVIVYYFLGIEVNLSEQAALMLLLSSGAAYCAFFLWLGRRQFAGLELKSATAARAAQIPQALIPRKLTELFRSRPTGATANLIRKEFCLQKPIFLVSGIFTMGWLLTLLLMLVRPAWQNNCVAVLHGLTGTQIVLLVILTGCVSLGDDKALGTTAWHLTLPVSTRRQWLVKLSVSAVTTITMTVLLPTLLAGLTLFKARVGVLALRPDVALGFVIPSTVIFVVSFWSASLVANTVRAALTCMAALTGIAACVVLGARVPEAFFISSIHNHGLQTGLISYLIARFQLPPDFFANHVGTVAYGTLLVALIVTLTMLSQSLAQFRRARTQTVVLFKYSVILAAMVLAGSFWCADLMRSINQQWDSPLVAEVTAALRSVSLQDSDLSEGRVRKLTFQDVEARIPLSDRAKLWLRNSTIEVRQLASKSRQFAHARVYTGELHFPNGVIVPLSWSVPDLP